jgi:hypothetical protein
MAEREGSRASNTILILPLDSCSATVTHRKCSTLRSTKIRSRFSQLRSGAGVGPHKSWGRCREKKRSNFCHRRPASIHEKRNRNTRCRARDCRGASCAMTLGEIRLTRRSSVDEVGSQRSRNYGNSDAELSEFWVRHRVLQTCPPSDNQKAVATEIDRSASRDPRRRGNSGLWPPVAG